MRSVPAKTFFFQARHLSMRGFFLQGLAILFRFFHNFFGIVPGQGSFFKVHQLHSLSVEHKLLIRLLPSKFRTWSWSGFFLLSLVTTSTQTFACVEARAMLNRNVILCFCYNFLLCFWPPLIHPLKPSVTFSNVIKDQSSTFLSHI